MAINQVVESKKQELVPGFGNVDSFELMQRQAKLLANSTLVPKQYQGNLSNCVIALNMANRINADPLMVMQNLYVVNGTPGWSAQFLIATFNASGKFSAIRYEWIGKEGTDSWGCRAWAVEKTTGERLEGHPVTIGTAKKEGWYSRNGSKWQTMPGQMLMYRSAAWFIRTHAPELAMGMHTVEEIIDMEETAEGKFVYEVEQNANIEELDIEGLTDINIEDAVIVEPEVEQKPEKEQDKPKKEAPKRDAKKEPEQEKLIPDEPPF